MTMQRRAGAALLGLAICVTCAQPPGHAADAPTCSLPPTAKVATAYKSSLSNTKDDENDKAVELGTVLAVKVSAPGALLTEPCRKKGVLLFLNGRPIKGLKSYPPPASEKAETAIWKFELEINEASEAAWSV